MMLDDEGHALASSSEPPCATKCQIAGQIGGQFKARLRSFSRNPHLSDDARHALLRRRIDLLIIVGSAKPKASELRRGRGRPKNYEANWIAQTVVITARGWTGIDAGVASQKDSVAHADRGFMEVVKGLTQEFIGIFGAQGTGKAAIAAANRARCWPTAQEREKQLYWHLHGVLYVQDPDAKNNPDVNDPDVHKHPYVQAVFAMFRVKDPKRQKAAVADVKAAKSHPRWSNVSR
jgi:hypothetical protein